MTVSPLRSPKQRKFSCYLIMTYSETLDFLYHSLPVFQHIGGSAYKAGLDNILKLDAELGDPHRRFASVHVAGTNGKGSVSHMVAAVLQTAGYRTGLFTSPHLQDFRERIRVNGEMISEEAVIRFVEQHRGAIDRIGPSFFEATTALAFDHFAREGVDVAVIEVGMGGRLDSTNIIRPRVSVITNISRDHAQFLGNTLPEIAGEKAGIIKEDTPVVIGQSQLETQMVFISRAKELHAPILFADQLYEVTEQIHCDDCQQFKVRSRMDGETFTLELDLQGDYQRLNLLTALTTLDVLNGAGGLQIPQAAVRQGLAQAARSTGLRGRWQILDRQPLTVCDTGHNEGGLSETLAQIARQTYRKLYMVLGFVSDKEIDRVLPMMPREAHYLFTQAPIERAMPAQELSQRAAAYGLQGETIPHVQQAVTRARELAGPEDMIYIGGSTFVVAELG